VGLCNSSKIFSFFFFSYSFTIYLRCIPRAWHLSALHTSPFDPPSLRSGWRPLKMSCSCRFTSARSLVTAIAQLQVSETFISNGISRSCRTLSRPRYPSRSTLLTLLPASHARRTRDYHTTTSPRRDDVGLPEHSSGDKATGDVTTTATANIDSEVVPDSTAIESTVQEPRAVSRELIGNKEELQMSAGLRREPAEGTKRQRQPRQSESAWPRIQSRSPKREPWQIQKSALQEKFPEGWQPRKRLSPDALAGIRALHEQFPDEYTTDVLARKFEVSPEAIRRILKSKWSPSAQEEEKRQERWFRRGKDIWTRQAELGKKPPRKWRKVGVTRDPSYHTRRKARRQALDEELDADQNWQKKLGKNII
jgi:hypothetical protein